MCTRVCVKKIRKRNRQRQAKIQNASLHSISTALIRPNQVETAAHDRILAFSFDSISGLTRVSFLCAVSVLLN